MPKDFAGNLVGFKRNLVCVQVQENKQAKILAKVINLGRKQQFSPSNDAACMMFYLMMQDQGDEVHFDELVQFVEKQYALVGAQAQAAVNAFLNELDGLQMLWDRPGASGGTNPDLLDLYSQSPSPKPNWPGGPFVTSGGSTLIIGTNTVFTGNYYRIIYRP